MNFDPAPNRRLLTQILQETGLKLSAIARRAGVSPSSLLRFMSGESQWLKPDTVHALMLAFPEAAGLKRETSFWAKMLFAIELDGTYQWGVPLEIPHLLCPDVRIEDASDPQSSAYMLVRHAGHGLEPDISEGDHVLIDMAANVVGPPGIYGIIQGRNLVLCLAERSPVDGSAIRFARVDKRFPPYDLPQSKVVVLGAVIWVAKTITTVAL